VLPGWPKYFDANIYEAPAMGDLDRDGRAEIVLLSLEQLIVLDVNQAPTPAWAGWPMYGYDPQRSGCADCPNDPAVAVEENGGGAISRVLLSSPAPNPTSGTSTLNYALPERAQVSVDVFDVHGRRVATLMRAEVEAGTHSVAWDGLDRLGRAVPAGRYLLRFEARGPQTDERKARPVTILR